MKIIKQAFNYWLEGKATASERKEAKEIKRQGLKKAMCAAGAMLALVSAVGLGNPVMASATGLGGWNDAVAPQLMYGDVIDTYLCYTCPNNISSHYRGMYSKTYKQIAFKNGYKVSRNEKIAQWPANVCGCGNGTVVQYKRYYTTY